MFSQASVNLFMRVGLGIGGVGYPGGKGYQRVGYSPPPKKNKQQKRSVRILLEYFLVWQDFLQKTAWKWKKLDREEVARDPSAPPPGSANAYGISTLYGMGIETGQGAVQGTGMGEYYTRGSTRDGTGKGIMGSDLVVKWVCNPSLVPFYSST